MDCSFCGHRIEKGTETVFVTKKGAALYFCSSKCEKNLLKLGRKPRKVRWTAAYKAEKEVRIKSLPVSEVKEEMREAKIKEGVKGKKIAEKKDKRKKTKPEKAKEEKK